MHDDIKKKQDKNKEGELGIQKNKAKRKGSGEK